MTDFFSDDLSDLIGSPAQSRPLPQAPEFVRIREQAPTFTEKCTKCGGTGKFRSWSGRIVGDCFTCKGAGSRTFKSSADQRQRAKITRAERAERAGDDNVKAFAERHPDVAAWIAASAPSFEFAASLGEALRRYGDLTERQLATAQRLAQASKERAERLAQPRPSHTIDASKIAQAFDTATQNGLRRPKLIIDNLRFSPAPVGKNTGSIYVKADGLYAGKITDGQFFPAYGTAKEVVSKIVAVAANPGDAAKAHGLKTGQCSCCGAELTNGLSVNLGIGPICREKYGF